MRDLRLPGCNLSFDMADTAQCVFLEGKAGLFRMESYTRRGSNIVDVVIPAGLTPDGSLPQGGYRFFHS